jgi:uncharacterized membrane protein YjgN (DUF898 family)
VKINIKAALLFAGGMALVGFLGFSGSDIGALMQIYDNPEAMEQGPPVALMAMFSIVYIAMFLVGILAASYAFVRQREYVYANSRFDKSTRFKSTIKARTYLWVVVSNWILIVCTLGLGMAWAKIRLMRTIINNTEVKTEADINGYLTQQLEEQSALGDQLGDAFDLDIGVGI